ncbi:hypothetical protein ES288_D11G017900v1 [Gossypium darwinii]|uniref:Uncharacterized protein n=1 Tax=Gossypium darwinii TaxID=34276 RepID=A0A5D2AG75_GOSDA|nr:hypothetical protein ES288_D11G017900v1 [Gossypium darwinii]
MWLQKTRRSLSLLLDKRVWFSQYFQLRSFSVFTMHGSYILNFPAIPGDISLSRGVKAATEMQAEAEHKKRAQATSSRIVEQYIQAFSNIVKDMKGIYLGTYRCLLNLSFMLIDRVTTMLLPSSTTRLLKLSPCTKAQF